MSRAKPYSATSYARKAGRVIARCLDAQTRTITTFGTRRHALRCQRIRAIWERALEIGRWDGREQECDRIIQSVRPTGTMQDVRS